MSELFKVIGNPHKRPRTTYHFKVIGIEENTVRFHDASRVSNKCVLPNESPKTLEQQYENYMDNLFIAVSYNGQYFFYTKLSNDKPWPKFLG
jgi:hypothetical protein